jgi:hypothetical protein
MLGMPGLRTFSHSATPENDGVSCSEHGVFVGQVPLLARINGSWTVRPIGELNAELTACYRLPVDVGSKARALALIATALNRSDRAMAAIAAVQMQFPDPPPLKRAIEAENEIVRRAVELYQSGLLKFAAWDPTKHPRRGTPPNPGWFAPVGEGSEASPVVPAAMVWPPWKKPEILEGGGGGGVPRGTLELPFPGGLPSQLAPYRSGKTSGIFVSPNGAAIPLHSGYDGPGADMEEGSFDLLTMSHVEGHAAALMREEGLTEGTLYMNNPKICDNCMRLLPTMLPPRATLDVVLPNGTVISFKGVNP